VSLLLSGFEMAMPVVGLLLGRALGTAVGGSADYVAIALLVALGGWLLVVHQEDDRVAELAAGRGLVLLAVGVSISLDELAMGFTIGLLGLSLWLAVLLIGAQALVFAQLGLRLGARLRLREGVPERLAGLVLLGLAVLLVAEKLG
jgi:putative Mn2+ efflux pump MntP